MGFKIVLVLFIVSVFYDCSAVRPYQEFYPASGNFRPRFKRCCRFLTQRQFYSLRSGRTTTTTTTEEPRKEYGKESRLSDDSIKKKYFVSQENRLSWYDARDACRKRGMVLTSPTTSLEKIELEHYIFQFILPKSEYPCYWIGGHRISDTGQFIWESNNEEIRPFGWIHGKTNGNNGENCMEFKTEIIETGWNTNYCSALKGYICESLPTTLESDKNAIKDSKESVHEEEAKESVNDNNGSNQLDSVNEKVQSSTEEYRDYSHEAEQRYQDILRRSRFYPRKSYDSEDDVSSSSAAPSRSYSSTITNLVSDTVSEAATDSSSAQSSERVREDVTVTPRAQSSERVGEDTTVTPSAQNSESPVTMQLYRHRSMPLIYQDYYPESDW